MEETPPNGELKLNFDVTHKNINTTTGVVLKNFDTLIQGVWVNHFNSDNPFCVEVEGTTQALKIVN